MQVWGGAKNVGVVERMFVWAGSTKRVVDK